jgi:hypothetical protein
MNVIHVFEIGFVEDDQNVIRDALKEAVTSAAERYRAGRVIGITDKDQPGFRAVMAAAMASKSRP